MLRIGELLFAFASFIQMGTANPAQARKMKEKAGLWHKAFEYTAVNVICVPSVMQ